MGGRFCILHRVVFVMGSVWSLVANRSSEVETKPQGESSKRQRSWLGEEGERPRLIPGLPDELSIGILARVPRIWHSNLKERRQAVVAFSGSCFW